MYVTYFLYFLFDLYDYLSRCVCARVHNIILPEDKWFDNLKRNYATEILCFFKCDINRRKEINTLHDA